MSKVPRNLWVTQLLNYWESLPSGQLLLAGLQCGWRRTEHFYWALDLAGVGDGGGSGF